MTTASATVKKVVNFRAISMRWPPITIASNAAPTLDISMINASTEMDAAAGLSNSGGTPAICASFLETYRQIGINPTNERMNIPAVPCSTACWLSRNLRFRSPHRRTSETLI